MSKRIEVNDLNVYYSSFLAVEGVSLTIEPRTVTAFIGPSGCGKSTFLRTLNRMHEVIPGARVEGEVLIDGNNLYGPGVDPVLVRRQVGMVFQRPNPFPTMSIRDNVLAGVKLNNRRMSKSDADDLVEKSLRGANLWNEVKDRLHLPGSGLSGGQQQRLCIARAIAVSPDVLLMDEPCSALDPISTLAIEDLIEELKNDYTIVIVTHNMQQASRVSDRTAFFNIAGTGKPGKLIEYNDTTTIFSNPTRAGHRGLRLRPLRLSTSRRSTTKRPPRDRRGPSVVVVGLRALGNGGLGRLAIATIGSVVGCLRAARRFDRDTDGVAGRHRAVEHVPRGCRRRWRRRCPRARLRRIDVPGLVDLAVGQGARPSTSTAERPSSFDQTSVAAPPPSTSLSCAARRTPR